MNTTLNPVSPLTGEDMTPSVLANLFLFVLRLKYFFNIYDMFLYHKYIHFIYSYIFPGYYSDPEAECQAFHICTADGAGGLAKYSFLCPNGTLFNQNYFICDWWFNFDCSTAEDLWSLNDEIAAERDALAGDQAGYEAPAEYGSASAPVGDYSVAVEEARRGRRVGGR